MTFHGRGTSDLSRSKGATKYIICIYCVKACNDPEVKHTWILEHVEVTSHLQSVAGAMQFGEVVRVGVGDAPPEGSSHVPLKAARYLKSTRDP